MPRLLLSTALAILTTSALGSAAEWRLAVEAGEFDRQHTIVAFETPTELRGNFQLEGPDNPPPVLQIDPAGHAIFVEPGLAKGMTKSYILRPLAGSENGVVAQKDGSVLKLSAQSGKRPLFHYQMEPGTVPEGVPANFAHGAHLHPVFSPSGRVVTADHRPDHRWQRGVWLAWTKTEFDGRHPDFWNMGKDGVLTGEVRFAKLERLWGGPVSGGFVSRHRFIDHSAGGEKEVLSETWEVGATPLPGVNVIDLTSTQTTAGNEPLKLPKYHYGGLGVRGAAEWDPEDQVQMLTSNGDNRKTGDATKGKWVYLGGQLAGQPAGIVVLIHPDNFRFPQALRLNPKNPQLCVAPSQDGDWEIVPGKPYISRYRLLVTEAAPAAEEFERQWNDYAHPPVARLSRQE